MPVLCLVPIMPCVVFVSEPALLGSYWSCGWVMMRGAILEPHAMTRQHDQHAMCLLGGGAAGCIISVM